MPQEIFSTAWGGWLWILFWSGLGAFIVEILRLYSDRSSTISVNMRWVSYILFGIICAIILSLSLEPSSKSAAFIIGIGWQGILTKFVNMAHLISVKETIVKLGL